MGRGLEKLIRKFLPVCVLVDVVVPDVVVVDPVVVVDSTVVVVDDTLVVVDPETVSLLVVLGRVMKVVAAAIVLAGLTEFS